MLQHLKNIIELKQMCPDKETRIFLEQQLPTTLTKISFLIFIGHDIKYAIEHYQDVEIITKNGLLSFLEILLHNGYLREYKKTSTINITKFLKKMNLKPFFFIDETLFIYEDEIPNKDVFLQLEE
jgi:hypothetical protein